MPTVERVRCIKIRHGLIDGVQDGLKLQIREYTVLVSKFHNGLKALPIETNEYKFLETEQVEITDVDLLDIEMAFDADMQFQDWLPKFKKMVP